MPGSFAIRAGFMATVIEESHGQVRLIRRCPRARFRHAAARALRMRPAAARASLFVAASGIPVDAAAQCALWRQRCQRHHSRTPELVRVSTLTKYLLGEADGEQGSSQAHLAAYPAANPDKDSTRERETPERDAHADHRHETVRVYGRSTFALIR